MSEGNSPGELSQDVKKLFQNLGGEGGSKTQRWAPWTLPGHPGLLGYF